MTDAWLVKHAVVGSMIQDYIVYVATAASRTKWLHSMV